MCNVSKINRIRQSLNLSSRDLFVSSSSNGNIGRFTLYTVVTLKRNTLLIMWWAKFYTMVSSFTDYFWLRALRKRLFDGAANRREYTRIQRAHSRVIDPLEIYLAKCIVQSSLRRASLSWTKRSFLIYYETCFYYVFFLLSLLRSRPY